MNVLASNTYFVIIMVMAFLATVLLFEGMYLLWNTYKGPDAKRIEQRLQSMSAASDGSQHSAVLKSRLLSSLPVFQKMLLSVPRVSVLDQFIVQSGVQLTVAMLLFLSCLSWGVGYLFLRFYLVFQSVFLQLVFASAVAALPLLYVQWKRAARLDKIEKQLPDAMDLICRALRAGHAFPASLKMVGEEMADPISSEFRMTHDEVNYGVTLQQALNNLAERIPLTDIRYFVIAVLIQRETGGNLAEILGNLSKLIRQRLQLHAKIKVLTAEGRLSAWILGLLPFGLAGLLTMGNPDFISVLWRDPAGIKLTQVTLMVMLLGALWLWRITKVRV
jgi:tight adherence protein B